MGHSYSELGQKLEWPEEEATRRADWSDTAPTTGTEDMETGSSGGPDPREWGKVETEN